jgi:hypothetical protein
MLLPISMSALPWICDGETGFILREPQDQRELASLIHRIQGDSTLRLSVGAAASRLTSL